ncbi:hypothetical protein GCM10028796_09750 [Ramlibacter monticola]|uniref:Universal stress protein n=1 Tax=Ramlibacter monticola TaxID=1926872 RepID=A0A936YXM3_9BURK|nr:universal stress protein [Ramlibacter monticola]MBL0389830.1 universal stress protein [Ramlibacter monticola]
MTQQKTINPSTQSTPVVVCLGAASSAGCNATWRAALVARELGAKLNILHPAPQPRVLAREEAALRELVEDIRQRTRVDVSVEAVQGNVLRHAVAASRDAAMMVLPSVRRNPLREWIMGTQAERLIRLCRSPVLVVKRPALASYQRVLVPLDVRDQSARVIALAASLSRGSRLEVLHAIDAGDEKILRELEGPELTLRFDRQHRAQAALLAVHQRVAAAQVGQSGAEASIAFGDAARVVLARTQAWDAELLVIGKAQRGLLAGYFLGGLTQCVLARASADVLVHPVRSQAARRVDAPAPQVPSTPSSPAHWGTLVRLPEWK